MQTWEEEKSWKDYYNSIFERSFLCVELIMYNWGLFGILIFLCFIARL